MKHKLKIIFLLFVIIGTLFASCTMEEEAIKNHNYSKDIKIYQKSFDELLTDKEFSRSFNKLPKNKSVIKSSTQGKTVMEQQYGFSITNTPVRVMQVGNITSYTFHIERDVNDNTYFENLVVQNDSVGNTSAQIIKYTPFMPMTSFAEHNSYSFEGNTEFSSIIYDDTPVNLTGKVITVCRSLWGTRCTANTYGYCVAPSHIPFSVCLTQNCLAQQFINETCTTYDDGEPEETPVGGGGGSSYNTGGGNNPVYSDPVCGGNCITEAGNIDHCETLTNMAKASNQNINPVLQTLKDKLSANASTEWGARFKNDTDVTPAVLTNEIIQGSQNSVPYIKGFLYRGGAHIHTKEGFGMLSWGDVNTLAGCYDYASPANQPYVTNIMVCNNPQPTTESNPGLFNTYAIKVDDYNLLINAINNMLNDPKFAIVPSGDAKQDLENKINKIHDAQAKLYKTAGPDNLNKSFLQQFSNYGISLFKKSNITNKWVKLSIDPITGSIIETPCN